MELADTTLSEAEKYALWCEQIRALFFPVTNVKHNAEEVPMNSNNTSSCSSISNSLDMNNINNDGDDFPYCFYMRMLSSGKKRSDQQSISDNSLSHSYSRSSSCNSQFSSVSQQQQQQQRYIDEDAYAARLASKLQTQARAIRKEQEKEVPGDMPSDGVQWPFRDGTVEAIAATVNEELHEMLMYVRKRNLLSEQLRRQLTQTKLLLLRQKEAS
ncbi:hypothetical protein LSM04_001837 [Trypanosoma melophagium]|uniref:uncharacterized protein n=1 Tax=Trypanosoma melophagium TaxID=715481 RepID=UPI003519EE3F|nr:hypothetical protein LSM04_001837 [Trypanosoma melophagium]